MVNALSAKRQLVALVENLLAEVDKQQAFVQSCFMDEPKLLSQIKVGGAARVFAIHLVNVCLAYGDVNEKPAVVVLLEELSHWVGQDRKQDLEIIQHTFLSRQTNRQTQTAEFVQVQQANNTNALIIDFYSAYEQEAWNSALDILDAIEKNDDVPHLFDINTYRQEISRKLGFVQEMDNREREYQVLKLRARYEPRERVWSGLRTLWQLYPAYDPDNLADWVFEQDVRYQTALQRIEMAYYDNATQLDLSELGLEVLPRAIGQLANLKWLNLSGNHLISLPPEVDKLTRLERLHLEFNRLETLPSSLMGLESLEWLYLDNNRLCHIPPEIATLNKLQFLGVQRNRLQVVPEAVAALDNLSVLLMSGNDLTELPRHLFVLSNLSWLLVSDNQIAEVPASVKYLTQLQFFSVSYNMLRDLPRELGTLPKLENLFVVRGNPLDMLPGEALQGGNTAVLRWLQYKNK